jgi:hypothetical protein
MIVLASCKEAGKTFETAKRVTFTFIRNTEKAPKAKGEDLFQQRLEPTGLYLLFDSLPKAPLARGWARGKITLANPLVLMWNTEDTGRYDEHSWKATLAKATGKRGKALNAALKKLGWDSVVTVREGATSEIVVL